MIRVAFVLVFTLNIYYSQTYGPYKLSRVDNADNKKNSFCESRVKVKDVKPQNCDFNGEYYFYPFIIEEFNFKNDLENNWKFNLGWNLDDSYEGDNKGYTWLGEPYSKSNIELTNGTAKLKTKKETVTGVSPNENIASKTYQFTRAFLKSLFNVRQGVFEAKIKLPNNIKMFPAFWLKGINEIDVFEFYDENEKWSNDICDSYHHLKMHVHGYKDQIETKENHCSRGRKFEVEEAFFNKWHIYKCVWTDYRIEFYLDNNLVGYTSKYYDGPYISIGACKTKVNNNAVPSYHRTCNYLSTAQECNTYVGWPINQCINYNKVDVDLYFPSTNFPMELYVSNRILEKHFQFLLDNWNSYSEAQKQIEVDFIKVYQPLNCNQSLLIKNELEFKMNSGKTNFLSGYNLTISNGSGSNVYLNEAANQNNSWHEFPTHIVATNEISFLNEVKFEEGTFLRAEIIDCSGGG